MKKDITELRERECKLEGGQNSSEIRVVHRSGLIGVFGRCPCDQALVARIVPHAALHPGAQSVYRGGADVADPSVASAKTDSTRHNSSSANKACQLVVSVDVYLSRADVRDLVERRREGARIRSGYYDDRPAWQRPVW